MNSPGICGKNVAARLFVLRLLLANAAYVVLTVAVALVFYKLRPHGAVAYALAILPSGGIVGVVAATASYIREEKDEFQRDLLVQCLLAGLGGVLAITAIWGLLQSFTQVVRFQPIWTFPLFWCCAGVAFPLISRRYR